MTEQQQRGASAELARQVKANAGLAQAMGYQLRLTMDNLPDAHVIAPDGKRLSLSELPDYFTDPVASRELVLWLAAQDVSLQSVFEERLRELLTEMYAPILRQPSTIDYLTAPLPVIAEAACKALGIEVSE